MFERLIIFFKKLFGFKDLILIEGPKNEEKEVKEEFFNSIIIVPNEQKEEAMRLQKQFQQGILEEEVLTDKQYNALSSLYQSQIDSLKQEITEYKQKIETLKKELA